MHNKWKFCRVHVINPLEKSKHSLDNTHTLQQGIYLSNISDNSEHYIGPNNPTMKIKT